MDLDVTFLVQMGILIALMLVLGPLLHSPLLGVMAAREQQTSGTLAEVRHLEKLTSADRATYDDRMREARARAHTEREALRQAGRDEARRIQSEARAGMVRARAATQKAHDALEQQTLLQLQKDRVRWRETLVGVALARLGGKQGS